MLIVSIILKENRCLNCSASLGPATCSFITCAYCGSEFYLPPLPGYRIPEPRAYEHPPGLGIVEVGSHAYRVHGRLAQGQHSDVFLARRERALTEMVVLKVARDAGEQGLRREWDALHKVRSHHQYLCYLTNAPILLEMGRCPGHAPRLTAVYQWRCGFCFTMVEARRQYPDGVDPRAVVWMWNRVLDQLACLQEVGFSHNAIAPEHLLLHPRDHGVVLCGWSEAARGSGQDLRDSGSCIEGLLGKLAPRPLRELARQAGCFADARALKQELKVVSEAVFGPPKFHHFALA
jgi:hypothetical protein